MIESEETTSWRYRIGQVLRAPGNISGPIIARSEQLLPGSNGEVRHSYRLDTPIGPKWYPLRSIIGPGDKNIATP